MVDGEPDMILCPCDFACICVFFFAIKVFISSMTENEVFIHESVDGVGKTTNEVNMNPIGSMLNVESVQ
jgi:hypothetical protein